MNSHENRRNLCIHQKTPIFQSPPTTWLLLITLAMASDCPCQEMWIKQPSGGNRRKVKLSQEAVLEIRVFSEESSQKERSMEMKV